MGRVAQHCLLAHLQLVVIYALINKEKNKKKEEKTGKKRGQLLTLTLTYKSILLISTCCLSGVSVPVTVRLDDHDHSLGGQLDGKGDHAHEHESQADHTHHPVRVVVGRAGPQGGDVGVFMDGTS